MLLLNPSLGHSRKQLDLPTPGELPIEDSVVNQRVDAEDDLMPSRVQKQVRYDIRLGPAPILQIHKLHAVNPRDDVAVRCNHDALKGLGTARVNGACKKVGRAG